MLPDLHSTEVTLPKKGLIVASSNMQQFQNACGPFSTSSGERSMTKDEIFSASPCQWKYCEPLLVVIFTTKESCILLLLFIVYIVIADRHLN